MRAVTRYYLYQDPAILAPLLRRAREALRPPSAWVAPWGFHACGFGDRLTGADGADGADAFLVPLAFSVKDTYDWTTEDGVPEHAVAAYFATMDAALGSCLGLLEHYSRYRARHVFVQWGDLIDDFPSLGSSIVLKVSAHRRSAAVAIPYFLADLEARIDSGAPIHTPIEAATIDVTFRGSTTCTPLRGRLQPALQSLAAHGFSVAFASTRFVADPVERQLYLDGIHAARFVLCPRGTGLNSARFFETLALGRIPILIADDAKLPLEGRIAYDEFAVRVPEDELHRTGEHVAAFLARQDLASASRAAHECYRRHLTSRRLRDLVDDALASRVEDRHRLHGCDSPAPGVTGAFDPMDAPPRCLPFPGRAAAGGNE